MNRITFPLKPRTQGARVADLQDALQLCLDRGALLANDEGARRELSLALKRERLEQAYGNATTKLVAAFQKERRLWASGEVDEPAANAFNALLHEWELLEPEDRPRSRVISGAVRREDGLPLRGVHVRAFHETKRGAIRLGEDTTDAEGRYTIRYEPLPAADAIDLSVVAVGEDGTTLGSSQVVKDAKPLATIDLTVPVAVLPAGRLRIAGTILLENGLPAEMLKLRLYRRDFGRKLTPLDDATTLAGGRYAFTYDAVNAAASLEVRAIKADGSEIPLSKALNVLTPEARANLNLLAPRGLQPLPAEYGRLAADLAPHVGQMARLAEAQETAEQQDITVLNRATGWDARLIALASVTEGLAADPDVKQAGFSSEALYGLLRAGLPSDKLLLAQVEPDVVETALKKVRDGGIVSISDANIAEFKTKFEGFANKTRLGLPVPGSRSTYGELLRSSGLPQEAQDKFASIYLKHRGSGAELWEAASKAGLDGAQIGKLQLQGKVAFLARNSEAMTTRLLNKGLKHPVELVGRDFYDASAWKTELFDQAGIPQDRRLELTDADRKKLEAVIPAAYEGAKVEVRLDTYAEDMARRLRLSYPTQVLGRLLETDQKFKFPLDNDITVKLLKRATEQGFRLGETPVSAFLKATAGLQDDLSDAEFRAAGHQIRVLQRIYQITPDNEAMPVLTALKMTSAYDVMAYPEEQFIALFKSKYFEIYKKPAPSGVPELVSRKAKQVSCVTYNLFAIAKKLENEPQVAGMSAPVEVRESVKNELIKHYPTMESLFGSMDYCECEHCRSVLSPAAYLVDLLQFVDTEPGVWGNFLAQWRATHGNQDYPHKNATGIAMKPYDVLIERRPDLPHIALTCENTHTALPYIDVVNEILEYYVANGRLDEEAAHDTTDATTPELLAEPQNVIREAYDTLRDERYPLSLPFDLWIESVRQFCDYVETPLHRVLEVLQSDEDLLLSIQNSTNVGDATVSVSNADATKVKTGLTCTFLSIGTNALSEESKRIAAVGAPDSGGAGQTTITLLGIWITAPSVGDRLVCRPLEARAATFIESLGISPAELAILLDTDALVNDKWHGLYGFPSVRTAIQNPTNAGNATLSVANVDAKTCRAGLAYTYFDVSANALSAEPKILASIGAPESGGAGRTTVTFEGTWTVAPDTGDLLVCDVPVMLKSAKALSRRLGVTYKEMTDIVQTGFVNPQLDKLSVLYKLDVGVSDAKFYKDEKAFYEANEDLLGKDRSTLSAANQQRFDDLAKKRPNSAIVGWQVVNDVAAFEQRLTDLAASFKPPLNVVDLRNAVEAIPFDRVLVLADPNAGCDFDLTTLRYADGTKADPIVFLRINLFVRLWRRLGWSIEETDRALTTFVPQSAPLDSVAANLAKQPLKTALIYLAHLKALDGKLKVGKQSRLKLLTLWSNIPTTGKKPLYAQLFLTRSVLKSAPVFDHPLGLYMTDATVKLKAHVLALQGALGLTADEIDRILEDAGTSAETAELSLVNASLLYRHGLLAKALKLSVRELIALKQLSGLDPFRLLDPDPLATVDQDHPFSQTLEFVKVAEEVKDSGLKIEDLDYLLRHRFDEAGRYRPSRDSALAMLKSLAEGVRVIRAEHAVPEKAGDLSDDLLKQKLGLALPPDTVERFLGMVSTSVEFTSTKSGVNAPDQLRPETFASEERIREIGYREVPNKEQKLTLRGVLFDAAKATLKASFDAVLTAPQKSAFAELLDGVQGAAREFFDNQLKKRPLRVGNDAGFLEDADFLSLFSPLEPLKKILPSDTQAEIDFKRGENAKTEKTNHEELQKRRYRIAQVFLPVLQRRLVRQLIVQTLTAQTGANPKLVESLVTDHRLLGVPESLLDAFAAMAERGLTTTFWASVDTTGPALPAVSLVDADTGAKDRAGNPLKPLGAGSARLEAYLEVPAAGAYRFFVELDKQNAEAELRFPHLPEPVLVRGKAGADHATLGDQSNEYLELRAGMLYRLSLELKHLNGGDARLLVQGETLPKAKLSQLTLYPAAVVDAAMRTNTLLSKALQLVQSLALSEREIRYMLTHAADFDGVSLSELPVAEAVDSAAEAATARRFRRFRRLAAYARLKRDLAGGTDDLIGILEANGTNAADRLEKQVYPRIAKLTRRDEATVKKIAEAFISAPAVPAFSSERPLWRLWEALQVTERFGVPPASLLGLADIVKSGTTADRRFELARDFKEAIRARFEPDTWQRVAQPIFDKLRRRQRDALVSHVMQQNGFDRMEQLYEYFLVDPGMEPVVQTSRIRLAIASLQLFVQRCLLNLEPKVHPSTINGKQWEWMKRYRVWEANRKIFLFPENWLEPEFRDDKTYMFSELEGALLQGDVSSDLVEDAFLKYLRRLDELARLEICAMHIEDNADPALRVLHVFGRTYSQPHKHFYRRYTLQMWTPWEPVSAEIEGDHLAPVVWRDRLYLFWVTFADQADSSPSTGAATGSKKLTDVTLTEVVTDLKAVVANKRVDVHLHWSEYLNGDWSTRESGGLAPVISRTVPSSFNRSDAFVHVSKEYDPGDGGELGVLIHLGGPISGAFYLAGRNSALESADYRGKPANPFNSANEAVANRYSGRGALMVRYGERVTTEPGKTPPKANPSILRRSLRSNGSFSLLPCDNDLLALGASAKPLLDPVKVVSSFGYEASGGGWRVGQHPRFLADLTGSGRADIVGFGNAGVYVSWNNGDGTFQAPKLVVASFGYDAGGWRVEQHPRFLADLTGSGRADIVGFGNAGGYVSLNNGDGTFQAPRLVVANFGYEAGGWRVEQHPRLLADLTGDGRADIVGFGNAGVWLSLNYGALESGSDEMASLIKPVFYQDDRNTFFVEPDLTERTIEDWQEWVVRTPTDEPSWREPDWWKGIFVIPEFPRKWPIPIPDDPWRLPIHPGSLINPVPDRDWLINPASVFKFGDVLIGPSGQPGIEIRDAADIAIGRGRVNTSPGSDLAGGSTVVLGNAESFAQSGLREIGGGLNVIGGAGFNAALDKNFANLNRSGLGEAARSVGSIER